MNFLWPEGKPKALTLSYDDGVEQDERLIGIFNRYGLKCSFHLNSGRFGCDNRPDLDVEKLRARYAGHEISCHSVTHPTLTKIPESEIIREVFADRLTLERIAGYPVVGMSYPMGDYNQRIMDILRAAGIICCRTVKATGNFALPEDFLAWHPSCHHKQALELLDAFLKDRYLLSLFFVWGHAYEFDNDDNWNLIEEFARRASGHNDVYYATNVDICRYVLAIRSLVGSADGRTFYNPTDRTVWFRFNYGGEIFSLAPGETRSFQN